MFKKIMKHMGTGLAIGFVITTACLWAFGGYTASGLEVMRQFTVWLFASALYGLSSIVCDTKIPAPAAIAIHFIICTTITLIAGFITLSAILELKTWLLYVMPTFFIIYIVIYAVVALTSYIDAKQINKKVQSNQKN